jgi:DNA (cytosine-5)-methyltransferase 1
LTTERYTAVSLYSGAGGFDAGFQREGFDLLWAIDADPMAIRTYREHVDARAVCGDVLETEPPSRLQPDVVIGGPPCQGFSVIGRMDPSDPRSRHVTHFLDVVERLAPRAFVMENVKALAVAPRWERLRESLLERAERLGYTVRIFVVNAADFGVPQARERMMMVGISEGEPLEPEPTSHGNPPTVRSALEALPRVGEPGNDGLCSARVVPAKIPVMRPTAYRGSLLFNGSGRPLYLDGPAKTLPASMGGNATPIVDQDELEHAAEPWVVGYHARLLAGGKPLRRAPRRMRRISVQEAAALQTFSAEVAFAGRQVSQYRQIGNAVPPNLAAAVAKSVRLALSGSDAFTEPAVLLAA